MAKKLALPRDIRHTIYDLLDPGTIENAATATNDDILIQRRDDFRHDARVEFMQRIKEDKVMVKDCIAAAKAFGKIVLLPDMTAETIVLSFENMLQKRRARHTIKGPMNDVALILAAFYSQRLGKTKRNEPKHDVTKPWAANITANGEVQMNSTPEEDYYGDRTLQITIKTSYTIKTSNTDQITTYASVHFEVDREIISGLQVRVEEAAEFVGVSDVMDSYNYGLFDEVTSFVGTVAETAPIRDPETTLKAWAWILFRLFFISRQDKAAIEHKMVPILMTRAFFTDLAV
jgi:hypothetical protein